MKILRLGVVLWVAVTSVGCAAELSVGERLRVGMLRRAVAAKDWGAAMPLANDLHRTANGDVEVLTLRAVVLRNQGMLDQAVSDLRAAIEIDDGYPAAHAALAITFEEQGLGASAEPHHRRAVELEPENPKYLNNLAFSLHARGRMREALELYLQAVAIDPANARLRNNLGFAYAARGDLTTAAAHFRHAGSPSRMKNNLGVVYQQRGDHAQACKLFREALALDAENAFARKNLQRVESATGEAPAVPEGPHDQE